MKQLEVRQKYSAARRIFNSLLSVSSGDETLRLILDISLQNVEFGVPWVIWEEKRLALTSRTFLFRCYI